MKFAILIAIVGFNLSLLAENIIFPTSPSAGVINVKTSYAVVGDGVTDDTAAINAAIAANSGTYGRVLYFPNGTYLVSDTITPGTAVASCKGLILQGQSQAGTIIKLKNNAAGFTDAATSKPMISSYTGTATNNQAFGNYIFNLTIDTGSGNAGANALSYLTNNYGSIRDVTVRSSDVNRIGLTGIIMGKAWPGPGMVRNVTVDGFNYGIALYNAEYSMTFEGITLRNQKTAGMLNSGNIVALHQLVSTNTVPALISTAGSLSVIMAAHCSGGSSTRSAVEVTGGKVLLHNVSSSGYQSAVKTDSTVVSGANQTDYVNNAVLSQFTSPQTTLGLPVEDTPEAEWDDLSKWASVTSFGAVADDGTSDTAAIQAAIDNSAGKTTLYFPRGRYHISGTVFIRNGIKRIYGAGSTIIFTSGFYPQSVPAFQFNSGTAPVCVFELFVTEYPTAAASFSLVKHNCPSAIVMRNLAINAGKSYTSTSGSGPLFVEDVAGNSWQINQQSAWMRQVNPEAPRGFTKIINDGGRLWILGLKTEKDDNVIETKNNAATEVLGGLLYPAGTVDVGKIAFINNESALSVSIAASTYGVGNQYANWVQETRSGSTLTLLTTSVPNRTSGKLCPLYVGYTAKPPTPDADTDGMSDAWESIFGFNPASATDAALDADGDGQSNLDEFRAATDPRQAGELFRIGTISGVTNSFTFDAQADQAYIVQYNNDLVSTGWQTLSSIPASAARNISVSYSVVTPRRFFRIITTP
ncbi:MAG: glycosyl hydrolase family 28-related protein [Verrucomicrobia bacterium]|nr:glycosyl hydrolase family 28-related protein [Verrucomicrobiota bacterium]